MFEERACEFSKQVSSSFILFGSSEVTGERGSFMPMKTAMSWEKLEDCWTLLYLTWAISPLLWVINEKNEKGLLRPGIWSVNLGKCAQTSEHSSEETDIWDTEWVMAEIVHVDVPVYCWICTLSFHSLEFWQSYLRGNISQQALMLVHLNSIV